MVDTNGTTTLGYDALYRQNAVTYPNGDSQSYTYDPMGNRLTKVNNGVTTSYTYDSAEQMTAAGGVTYGYDNNGNQTGRGTDTFGYNAENRLTSTSLGGTSGSYVYNGDGLRTSRTIGGTTTTFAWGNAAGMPLILRDSAGNRYLYGLDLISVSDSANKKFYHHTDGLGSTTAVTDSTGAVKKTYQYDVFGAIRVQTGTQPNEFTFTGEQVDSSGLQYLRARFYDNATGRFLIRDPLPLLHRYPYVGNNPVNYVDPYGLCGICDWANDNIVTPVEDAVNTVVDFAQSDCGHFIRGSASFLLSVENPELMLIGAVSRLLNFELNAPRYAKEGNWFKSSFSTASFLGNFSGRRFTGIPYLGIVGNVASALNTANAGRNCISGFF